MGTRSMTIVLEGNKELVRFYRQYDGYPEGHGVDLAKLCDVTLVNGIGADKAKIANGMGCLAAQIIAGLKDGPGNIYIEADRDEIGDWVEYVYVVSDAAPNAKNKEGTIKIACSTQTGPWPFNAQAKAGHVFTGTPAQWLKKYAKKEEVA
jgi:hypothetical protein